MLESFTPTSELAIFFTHDQLKQMVMRPDRHPINHIVRYVKIEKSSRRKAFLDPDKSMREVFVRLRQAFVLATVPILACNGSCKTRTESHSDFQSSSESNRPICADLTETLLAEAPSRDALRKAPITTYRIGKFDDAVRDVQYKFSKGSPTFQKNMFIEEAAAITLYTERAYRDINTALYNRNCDTFKSYNEAIASGLNKTAAFWGKVYRGGEIIASEAQDYVVGGEIIAPAFLSATTDETVAQRFKRNALFVIEAQGLGYIGWISANGGETSSSDESEVLIPPGTKFAVQSIEDKGTYKLVTLKQKTRSMGSIRYPAQIPQALSALNMRFTKGKVSETMRAFAQIFRPGNYSGKDCQVSIVLKPDGNEIFTVTRAGQATSVVDSTSLPNSNDAFAEIESRWDYPNLKVNFSYVRDGTFKNLDIFQSLDAFQSVDFDLNGDSIWRGITVQRQTCEFETPQVLSYP